RILIQVATPAVLIGLLLCGTCLVSAWYANRLQSNLATILAQNVSSMRAAQQLEIATRQLRFHCFLYLIDPQPDLLDDIERHQEMFEEWLDRAALASATPREQSQMQALRDGYDRFRSEFERDRAQIEKTGPRRDFRQVDAAHPIRHLTDVCRAHLRTNEEMTTQ